MRQRVADLEAEIRDLRNLLAPPMSFPSLKLQRKERRALAAIIATAPKPCHIERVYAAIYDEPRDDPPDINTVHCYVSKCRRALRPHRVTIRNERYIGYSVDAAGLQKLRELAA